MLVCAIMIKRKYQHSVIYDVNLKKIMEFFGVSYKKAKKLQQAFTESDMFIYNQEKKTLFAKSFKSNEKVIYGKNGKNKYEAFADYCYKMQMSDKIVLREVVRELRNILILNVIDAVMRYGGDNLKSSKDQYVTEPQGRCVAIPQRLIGKSIGLSRSSAGRYIKELEDKGRVSKTLMVAECVIPTLNEYTEKAYRAEHPNTKFFVWHDTKQGGWSAWVMYGYSYTISNRKDSDAFQHVIWNYDVTRRKGAHVSRPKISCELDGYIHD